MRDLRFFALLPARIWMAVFLVLPLLIIVAYSLLTRGDYGGVEYPWTVDAYQRIVDPLYLRILLRSLLLAFSATLLCVALGFPLTLFIVGSGNKKSIFLQLVTLPFWTSFLVRTYAWVFLLRDTGIVNSLLLRLGFISHPLPLLYNDGAVLIGLVYGYLPFLVLPLYATLERLDPTLLEAAADLGASPLRTLWRVTIPQSLPGVLAGAVLVFISCLGSYLTSDLLGGGKTVLIGNLIQNQFTTARDWPFGSALSLSLIATSMLLLYPTYRSTKEGVL